MKVNNEERDYILDSSLISTTFCKQESNKIIYDSKLIYCNNYIQLYTFSNEKIKKNNNFYKEEKKSKIDISILDTDSLKKINLISENNLKEIDLKNIIRSKLKCQRLAKCNSNIWETFITLTFKDNITDINFANREFNKFITKIKRVYKELKYICVPEFQKRGAVHYHLLTNININNEKLIYKQFDNKKFFHIKYWNNGFDKIEIIKGDIKKIIGYISKYMTKDVDNRLFGKHRYFYSQNLNKPIISYLDLTNEKHIDFLLEKLKDKKLIYENNYINEFFNEKIKFQEFLINDNIDNN